MHEQLIFFPSLLKGGDTHARAIKRYSVTRGCKMYSCTVSIHINCYPNTILLA